MPTLADLLRSYGSKSQVTGLLDVGDYQPLDSLLGPQNIGSRFGVKERQPYASEAAYFKSAPQVAGMATQDNKIAINPYSKLSPQELDAVRMNEAARVHMRNGMEPNFSLTPQQDKFLSGTTYANASPQDRSATIAARLLSSDPSSQWPTKEQMLFVNQLKKKMGLLDGGL